LVAGFSLGIRIALICAALAGVSPVAAQGQGERDWLRVMPLNQGDDVVCADRNSFAMRDGRTYFEAAFCNDVDAGNENESLLAFSVDCTHDWTTPGELRLGEVDGPQQTVPIEPNKNGAEMLRQVCAAVAKR
jgi:hypothetical protein